MKTQWKRRLTQTSLLTAMLTMAIGGVGSAYAAENNNDKEAQMTSIVAQPAIKITTSSAFGVTSSNVLLQPALQRNYLKLLASTYAPDTVQEWKQALEERKQVENEMPKPQFAKRVVMMKKAENDKNVESSTEADSTASNHSLLHIELPTSSTQPETTKQSSEAEQATASKKVQVKISKDGAIMSDLIQAIPVEGKVSDDIIKAELPESFKRQQKLAEAVEADDTATIRSLLPELLKDYKSETETLRKVTKAIKLDAAQPTQLTEPTK